MQSVCSVHFVARRCMCNVFFFRARAYIGVVSVWRRDWKAMVCWMHAAWIVMMCVCTSPNTGYSQQANRYLRGNYRVHQMCCCCIITWMCVTYAQKHMLTIWCAIHNGSRDNTVNFGHIGRFRWKLPVQSSKLSIFDFHLQWGSF